MAVARARVAARGQGPGSVSRGSGVVPDPAFSNPRLASLYDAMEADRSDLDAYVGMIEEFSSRRVLDIGCGTGTLAVLLARRGIEVTGLDPASASLDVARSKPGAERVTWLHEDATGLSPMQLDLALMTGNVAQVFLSDQDWDATLAGVHTALRPGGRLVFANPLRLESRQPSLQLQSRQTVDFGGFDCRLEMYRKSVRLPPKPLP